jgi:hypothetical protein
MKRYGGESVKMFYIRGRGVTLETSDFTVHMVNSPVIGLKAKAGARNKATTFSTGIWRYLSICQNCLRRRRRLITRSLMSMSLNEIHRFMPNRGGQFRRRIPQGAGRDEPTFAEISQLKKMETGIKAPPTCCRRLRNSWRGDTPGNPEPRRFHIHSGTQQHATIRPVYAAPGLICGNHMVSVSTQITVLMVFESFTQSQPNLI